MIISHKHRFIFIKTLKTAGTSLEIALSKYCGDNDIITHQDLACEQIRKELGYQGPNEEDKWHIDHTPANTIRDNIDPQIWDQYFKFCFERNPWDKVISYYYWRCQNLTHPHYLNFSFSRFMKKLKLIRKTQNFKYYTINGKVIIDHVYRYENFSSEIAAMADRIGLPEIPTLPFAKAGIRPKNKHYRKYYNKEEEERVRQVFAKEIKHFGYEF